MFNEVHKSNGLSLVFVRSSNIQAFPCGRRRGQEMDSKLGEKYCIPFDPEARLNTEYNNLRHSSLNGFTQSYINKWEQDQLSLVINNYLFNISFDADLMKKGESTIEGNFGKAIADAAENTAATKIYANIRVTQVPLYSGFETYSTPILRDQTNNPKPGPILDLLNQEAVNKPELLTKSPKDYFYFSGLSFSVEPLTAKEESDDETKIFSLQILEKVGETWQIYQPSLLPRIAHGNTSDSIKVGTIYADNVLMQVPVEGGNVRSVTIPSVELVQQGTSDVFRLAISSVTPLD
jgi:hypothetical protein